MDMLNVSNVIEISARNRNSWQESNYFWGPMDASLQPVTYWQPKRTRLLLM